MNKYFPMNPFFFDDDFFLTSSSNGLNIYEEDNKVIIEAALPGLSAEDIEITHAHGYLVIEGEKKEEEKKRKYYRKASRSFSYRIPIPAAADTNQEPEATYHDGIMKITFKKGEKKGKSIPIKKTP